MNKLSFAQHRGRPPQGGFEKREGRQLHLMANDTFSALADPTRRGILELLAGNPELSATQIYERFDVSPQAISQHLKILRETQLVRVEKRAQQRIYSLNIDPVKELEHWAQAIRQQWDGRLNAMDRVLAEEMAKRIANQANHENKGE